MLISIDDIMLSYEVNGAGDNLILLHGWGCNKETFTSLAKELKDDYTVYQIDLPGFGTSTINKSWCVDDYVELLQKFILINDIHDPIILGHSFGGRIAIKYASKYPVSKLILVGTPGIREKLSIWKKIKIITYKLSKRLKIKIRMGSTDYQKATELMQQTLVKTVNEDLSPYLAEISIPTLLVWGENDQVVKLKIAKEMNQKIHNSGLIVIPNCGHFPYLERFRYFLLVLKSFLNSDEE